MVKEHAPPLPLINDERSLNPETEVFILFICVTDEYFFRFLKGEIVQEGKRWLIIILSYSMTPNVWDNSHYKKKLGSARTAVNVKKLTAPRRILGTKTSATAKVISRFCR